MSVLRTIGAAVLHTLPTFIMIVRWPMILFPSKLCNYADHFIAAVYWVTEGSFSKHHQPGYCNSSNLCTVYGLTYCVNFDGTIRYTLVCRVPQLDGSVLT
jgi:hypothetical protein